MCNDILVRLPQESQKAKHPKLAKKLSTHAVLGPKIPPCAIWTRSKTVVFTNSLTQHRASLMHQLANVTQMILMMNPSWIEKINVTNCSKQSHQSQHHRGFNGHTNPCRITSGSIHKVRGIRQIFHVLWWQVHALHHRSHLSVVATLVQKASKSRPSTDEASKFTGASSKSKPVGQKSSRTGCSST